MKIRSAATLAMILATAAAGTLEAQTHRTHLGPHIGYSFEVEELAIGAQFSAPIGTFLEFYPSFDYFLIDNGSLWGLNADLKLRVSGEGLNWLYLGGGLNVMRRAFDGNSDNEAGANIFAGFETISGNVHPFGELRFSTTDRGGAQFNFGLNFTLGPR